MATVARVLPMIALVLLLGVLGTWAFRQFTMAGPEPESPPVAQSSLRMDDVHDALAGSERFQAFRAWDAAWTEAVASRRWEPLIAVGDAALQVGQRTGLQGEARALARRAYHTALSRARASGSVDGVVRAADAFAALGDRDVSAAALQIARQLAASSADRERRARLDLTTAGTAASATLPQPR